MAYLRVIRMEDTDMTGVIFFARLHAIALEAIEDHLAKIGLKVSTIINQGFLLPIVHSEASFFSPIFHDDLLTIHVVVSTIKNKSMTFEALFLKDDKNVAVAKLTHVLCDKESKKGILIPEEFKKALFLLPKKEDLFSWASSGCVADKEESSRL